MKEEKRMLTPGEVVKGLGMDEAEADRFADGVIIPNLQAVIEDPSWRNLFNATCAFQLLEGGKLFHWKAESPLVRKLLPPIYAAIKRIAAAKDKDKDQAAEAVSLGEITEAIRDTERPDILLH